MNNPKHLQGQGKSLATKIYGGVLLAGAFFFVLGILVITTLAWALRSHHILVEKTLPLLEVTHRLERSVFDYLLITRSESLFASDHAAVSSDQLAQLQQTVNDHLSQLQTLTPDGGTDDLIEITEQLRLMFANANSTHDMLLPTHRKLSQQLEAHRAQIESDITKAQALLQRHNILQATDNDAIDFLQLRKVLSSLNEPIFKYAIGQGLEAIEPVQVQFTKAVRAMARLNVLLPNEPIRKNLAEINRNFLFHAVDKDGFFACALATETNISRFRSIDRINRAAERLLKDRLINIVTLAKTRAQNEQQHVKSQLRRDLWVTVILVIVICIATFSVIYLYIKPQLVDRLRHLALWINRISAGDYTQQVDINGNDEIARMSAVLERFRTQLIERDELNNFIQMNEIYLHRIIEYAADGLLTLDHNGRIETYNPACEAIFGFSKEDVTKKNLTIDDLIVSFHDLRDDLARQSATEGLVCYGHHADGHQVPLEISLNKISLPKGDQTVLIIRDVSERRQAEQDREQLIEQLTDSNNELERFAYIASHDLQEPLRMVRNFCDLLAKRYSEQLDDNARQYIDIAVSSAARMQDLIEDLLEYARISETVEHNTEVDLNQVVTTALENVGMTVEQVQAQVNVATLPRVFGNHIRFIRVFTNIFSNALKYQAVGNVPAVMVDALQCDGGWQVNVQDNGIGMKAEYCEQIFLPFNRLHGKGEFAGTGIGLAICRKILTMLGGKIWISSQPGEGSTVHLFFPNRQL